MRKFAKLLFLSLVSAFLGALAFPNFLSENGLPFLAFVFLIPVFYVTRNAKLSYVWLLGLLHGFLYYLVYNFWLKTFHPLAILIAPTLESVQYLFLFLALALAARLFKKRGWIAQVLVYSGYLYLTEQGFLAYPYGNLTSAVYKMLPLIQIVDIGGIWLLGLILVVPQALMAEIWSRRSVREYRADIGLAVMLLILTLFYGVLRIGHYDRAESIDTLRLVSVQHSADSWKGGDATYRKNFENLRDMTIESLVYEPDYVVWSETAFVPSVSWNTTYKISSSRQRLCEEFVEFGKSLPVPLISGNVDAEMDVEGMGVFRPDGEYNWKTYNAVMLFGDGRLIDTYRKQHLVPFTEYFPYEKEFPRLYAFLKANDYKWWETGTEAKVLSYDGLDFATPICFEDMFGYLSAEFVRNGADLLINLTNDSWSGSVSAELQHLQLASFRAVENRRPLLRSTNSGMTCLVDVNGRIIDQLEPFTMTYGVYDVEIGKEAGLTFYTRHPDLFGRLFALLGVLVYPFGAVHYLKGRKREEKELLSSLFESLPDFYEV